jgi:AcrR family transcriptional regulator
VPQTQQERREGTRLKLLDATIECLVELGYAGTTFQRVQDRAGVSRGALLHHFASKEDLLVAAVHHVATTQSEHVRASAARGRIAGLAMLREVMSGPVFLAGLELWLAARTEPALREALRPAEREVGQSLRAVFVADDRVVLEGLLALLRGLAVTSVLRDDPKLDRAVVQLWVDRVLVD